MAKQVTLNLKSLTGMVSDLEALKAKITAHAGTQAARLAAARAEVLPTVKVPTLTVKASDTIEAAEAAIEDWKSTLTQRIDEAVTGLLKAKATDTETGLTALRETFKAKHEAATAMKSVMVGLNIAGAEAVEIPSLKGTGRIGTGTTRTAGSKAQDFYTIRNGVRSSMAPSQNKLSSLAWYHGAEIGVPDCTGNKSKGCPSSDLVAFLKAKGVDVSGGKAWSFKVSETFTVGMDVEDVAGDGGNAA